MKTIFTAFVLCLLLNGCKKEDATDSSNDTNGEETTLTLSFAQATPGDMLEIKLNKKVTENEVDIIFNMNTVKGYANGDSTYMFIVPIVASGNVIITIPSFKGANPLSLTISKYEPIINPQTVINEFVEARNQSIDSITKVIPGRNYQASAESVILLNQLKEEWALQMEKLSESDKEMLAYVLQKNMLKPTLSLAPTSLAHTTKSAALQEDAGEKLVALAKSFVTAELICLAHIPILAASILALSPPTTVLGSIVFISIFTSFIISREVAIMRGEQVGEMQGLADAIVDILFKSATVIEFTNNSEMALSMSVEFRNLNPGDASIQADINSAFNTEKTFVKKDDEIRNLYKKATSLFSKLVGTYPSYSPVIGSSAKKTSIQTIDGADIQIKGVSDNRINYTTSLSGKTRKIKITSTATTEFNFNLTIAYKRKLDGKEFTKEIACTFKPQSYKLGFSDYTKGSVTDKVIEFANSELASFILLNENGTTATGIDYSQISITNKTNQYVTIGIVPVLGTNGSFILQFKKNSPTSVIITK